MRYYYDTTVGRFWIVMRGDDWVIEIGEERAGPYTYPAQAADELAGGHTNSFDVGDTSGLGIPANLSEWRQAG